MKKILVTGTLGFIFSNFIKKVVDEYPEYSFIGVDKAVRIYNLKNEFTHPNYKFYLGDIADAHFINNVFEIEKPNIIINGCAESHVDHAIENFLPFLHSNVIGVQTLVDAALKFNIERFIHISTDEVLGHKLNKLDTPWTEESPLEPRNPYAASKACSELIINTAHMTHGLQYNITRSCNVFGPHQKRENLIPHILHGLIKNKPINIHGNGKNFRQYIYVEDKINAIMKIVKSGEINNVYNICSDNFFTNLEMIDYISNLINKTTSINFIADRKAHDQGYVLTANKLKYIGWKDNVLFKEGMNKTIEWYLKEFS